MILIVGGISSGKREFAMSEYGFSDMDMSDAVLDDKPVIYNLQDLVAQNPGETRSFLPDLFEKRIVICNEVGCGIVPASHKERELRESVGRICIILAKEAEKVIRLCSGIPTVIKG